MQGFNMGRYVPPDLEGTTSFNVASGKGHALGARARKLKSEGVLVVRFECPFAIWCTNCQPEQIIGQGVRFNAEKKKVGNYYSTPIWSFKIKHTTCGKLIEVRTDPKNAEYVVVEGGRRRDTGADKLLEGEIRIGASEEEKQRLEKDGGFGILEKNLEDKREAGTQKRRLEELASRSERDWADPYEMSKKLRKDFRVGRQQRQTDEKSGEALQDKFGLGLDIVAPSEEDAERAGFVQFGEAKSSHPASKSMFVKQSRAPPKIEAKDRGKRGKGVLHDALSSKEAVRTVLQTNTRTTLDPFLRTDTLSQQNQWRPKVKKLDANDFEDSTPMEEAQKKLEKVNHVEGKGLVAYDSDSS